MSTIKTGLNVLFGTWGDDFAKEIAKGVKSEAKLLDNGTKLKAALEADTYSKGKTNIENIIKNRKEINLFKNPIKTLKTAYANANDPALKAERELVKKAAKNASEQIEKKGILGTIQKSFVRVGKELNKIPHVEKLGKYIKGVPLVGAALFLLPEIPNVINAFKEGGIVNGLKQTVKSTATVAVSALSFVGGQTAAVLFTQLLFPIPGLGFILGIGASMIGEKVVSKVFNALSLSPNIEKNESQENPFV